MAVDCVIMVVEGMRMKARKWTLFVLIWIAIRIYVAIARLHEYDSHSQPKPQSEMYSQDSTSSSPTLPSVEYQTTGGYGSQATTSITSTRDLQPSYTTNVPVTIRDIDGRCYRGWANLRGNTGDITLTDEDGNRYCGEIYHLYGNTYEAVISDYDGNRYTVTLCGD